MRDYAEQIEALRIFNVNYDSNKLTNDAADTIEDLLEEKAKLENSGKLLVAAFDLAKEKLRKYRHEAFIISETCVEESKCHISPENAIKKIREHIYYDSTASCSDPLEKVMDDWITIQYDPKDMIPIDDFEEVKKLLEAACSDAIISKLEQDILYGMKGEENA